MSSSFLCVVASFDDLVELWLEGSTSDQETINVFFRDELCGVSIRDGSTVKNSNRLLSFFGDVLSEPFSDLSMSLLSDFWSGNFTSSDSPDWLVSDNDVGPVVALSSDGVELSLVNFLGDATFSLFLELSNACKDAESSIEGKLGLLGDIGVSLSVKGSSLGVTGEGPLESSILEHTGRELSSESTVSGKGEVLGSNVDVV